MIFSRYRVSCYGFGDCHDENVVAGVNFIDKRKICVLYLQGEGVLLGSPYEDSDSGSLISSSMVTERNLRSPCDDSAAYVVPDDTTANILSAI